MHFNGPKLSSALEEFFLSLHNFWVQKCQNQLLEENKRFNCSFDQIEVQVITNLSSRLEKHQILEFLFMTDF